MDKEMEYEDFIKIIISKNLGSFDTKHWKKYINIVNSFDNTYPLFWACEHACLDEVKLLLENGAEFIPKKGYDGKSILDNNYVNKDCLEIIFSMISFDCRYDNICYIKFRNKILNNYQIKINNNQNNYYLIITKLFSKYNSFLSNNYFDYYKLKCVLISGDLNIIKYILGNINFDTFPILEVITLFNNFKYIIKIFAERLKNIKGNEKDILCYKEFKRIKIIFIIKLVSKFFGKYGLFNYDYYDKKIEKILGTYENSNLVPTRLFREKLNLEKDLKWYKDVNKSFDDLIERYDKGLKEFLE
jgi:hypothetical protein